MFWGKIKERKGNYLRQGGQGLPEKVPFAEGSDKGEEGHEWQVQRP